MSPNFDVTGILPQDEMGELPAGTNLLITGPGMIGKRELAIQLLAAGHQRGDGILCVTTSKNAASLLDEFESQIPTLDRERVAIVDCSGSDQQRTIKEIATEQVSSPGDLTGISIGTAKLLKRFADRDVPEVRHGLVSVSTLIQYLDLETVFKFIHIYTSRIDETGGLGIFTVDNTSHDRQAIDSISSEFDYVVQLREAESGDREVRVKGHSNAARTWQPF